jgi:hypothetical protein
MGRGRLIVQRPGYAMEFLLLVNTFGMVLVLFATAGAMLGWAIVRLVRALRSDPEPPEQGKYGAPHAANQWDPNHPLFGKRAGQ